MDALDIRDVKPDLDVPDMMIGKPSPGRRVKQITPGYEQTDVYHTLYLPVDWKPDREFPIIIEYAGNGGYENKYGDISTGRVEDSKLGYGISSGEGFIWVCMPFLNEAGDKNAEFWWGDEPTYNPQTTIDYCYGVYRDDGERKAEATLARILNLPFKIIDRLEGNVFREAGRLNSSCRSKSKRSTTCNMRSSRV